MEFNDLRGEWFIPAIHEARISGIFNFNKGGSELILHGNYIIDDDTDIEVIQGFDFDGNRVTLFDNWLARLENFEVVDCVTYFQSYAIIGQHYSNKNEVLLKEIDFTFDSLKEWIPINLKVMEEENNYVISNPHMFFNDVKLVEGYLRIYFETEYTNLTDKIALTCEPRITLEFEDPIKMTDVMKLKSRILDYFRFITGFEVEVNKLKCIDDNDIELSVLIGNPISDNKTHYNETILSFHLLSKNMEESLIRWLNVYDDFYPIIRLYNDSHRFFDEKRFLNLIRGVESIARIKSVGQLKFEDFIRTERNQLNTILMQLNDEDSIDWIKSRIYLTGEPNLRLRLTELFSSIEGLNLSNKRIKSFTNKIVSTRNYLVHLDITKRDQCLESYRASIRVLELVLLIEIAKVIGVYDLLVHNSKYYTNKIKIINNELANNRSQ